MIVILRAKPPLEKMKDCYFFFPGNKFTNNDTENRKGEKETQLQEGWSLCYNNYYIPTDERGTKLLEEGNLRKILDVHRKERSREIATISTKRIYKSNILIN